MNTPLDRLKYHVTGAIERGEAEPVFQIDAMKNYVIEIYSSYPSARKLARIHKGTLGANRDQLSPDALYINQFQAATDQAAENKIACALSLSEYAPIGWYWADAS